MFSGIQKLFNRAFIVGFFLPSFLFVIAIEALFAQRPFLHTIIGEGKETDTALMGVTLALLSVWLISLTLLTANYFFYRLLEGYLRPLSNMNFLKQRQLRRFRNLQEQKKSVDDKSYARALVETRTRFPPSESELMPTGFGNAIRAFETYPHETYGADAISMWLRLITVIPNEFREQIDDARSQVDFFVNICFLSTVIAVAATARLLVGLGEILFKPELFSPYRAQALQAFYASEILSALGIVGATVSAVAAYYSATFLIPQWGDLAKSAFDCYLPSLANQLGYLLPKTGNERRRFWTEFSQLVLYGTEFKPSDWQQTVSETKLDAGNTAKEGDNGEAVTASS